MGIAIPDEYLDRLFDLLSDAERRHLCVTLLERDEELVDVEELVRSTLTYHADDEACDQRLPLDGRPSCDERSSRDERPSRDERLPRDGRFSRDRAATRLVHCHLPKFADAGVLAYEAGDDVVRLRDTVAVQYLATLHRDRLLRGHPAADGATPPSS